MASFTAVFSMFGVFFLGAIITFLLMYGAGSLSFGYLSSKTIGGLAIPMINTLISIALTMAMALPIGLMAGIYFAEYTLSGGKQHKILGTFIDLLSGIPSLIFGIGGLLLLRP